MLYGGGAARPTAILVHSDLFDRLLNSRDDEGRSLMVNNDTMALPPTIRGLPVVPKLRLPTPYNSGQVYAIVADWSTMILMNNTAAVSGGVIVSDTNGTNLQKGLVSFILDLEHAFIVENPNAVVTMGVS